jgi:hypothetical protein
VEGRLGEGSPLCLLWWTVLVGGPVLAGLLAGLIWCFRLFAGRETSLVEAGFRFPS